MISVNQSIVEPTIANGYARGPGESVTPHLWPDAGAWASGLGPTGATLFDVSGRRNHGTLTNGPTWVVSEGRYALDFLAASSRYVALGQIPNVVGSSTLTVSAWLNRASASDIIALGRYKINTRVSLQAWSDGFLYWVVDTGTASAFYRLSDTSVGWFHLAFVFDGSLAIASRIRAFLNGKLAAGTTVFTPPTTIPAYGSDEFRIGVMNSTVYSTGKVDDFFVDSRAFADAEIKQLFNLGRGGIFQLADSPARFVVPAAGGDPEGRLVGGKLTGGGILMGGRLAG